MKFYDLVIIVTMKIKWLNFPAVLLVAEKVRLIVPTLM